jgi:preprotein translocase subunit SecG
VIADDGLEPILFSIEIVLRVVRSFALNVVVVTLLQDVEITDVDGTEGSNGVTIFFSCNGFQYLLSRFRMNHLPACP